jgi:anti-sigma B factor antagonist
MDASFMVTNRRSGCCELIELAGELDMATAPHLEAVLDRMLVIPDHIAVDMTRLTFIDSTGLRLLLRASKLVEGRIWLQGASLHICKVLDVAGIREFFSFAEDGNTAHRLMFQTRAS